MGKVKQMLTDRYDYLDAVMWAFTPKELAAYFYGTSRDYAYDVMHFLETEFIDENFKDFDTHEDWNKAQLKLKL